MLAATVHVRKDGAGAKAAAALLEKPASNTLRMKISESLWVSIFIRFM